MSLFGRVKLNSKKISNLAVRWGVIVFSAVSLVFLLLFIPIFIYLNEIFSELQMKRYETQLNYGATQIEQMVKVVVNTEQTLASDTRFLPLRYKGLNYDDFTLSLCNHLQRTFSGLLRTSDYISDCVLQFEEDIAFTPEHTYYRSHSFYPNYFQVDNFTYEEWKKKLSENKGQFMGVCQITSSNTKYDALIYVLEWTKDAYLYACIDITQFLNLLMVESSNESTYIEIIRNKDQVVLYNNLPSNIEEYHTFSVQLQNGGLEIKLFVENFIIDKALKPLYYFILMFLMVCISAVIMVVIGGSYFSMKPFLPFFDFLDNYKKDSKYDEIDMYQNESKSINIKRSLSKEVDYVSDKILNTAQELKEIKETMSMQQIIIKARFMEKALNEQLNSVEEVAQFNSLFFDFPMNGYYLVLVKIKIDPSADGKIYESPLLLISSYLKYISPEGSYYEQLFSDNELLMIVRGENFDNYRKSLDFIVTNVNEKEACYELKCFASSCYYEVSQIANAYMQLRNMEGLIFREYRTRVCVMDGEFKYPISYISMSQFVTFYTAISSGNCDIALMTLHNFSGEAEQVASSKKISFDMVSAVLHIVKEEKKSLLANCDIPSRMSYKKLETGGTLGSIFEETVETFCNRLKKGEDSTASTFAQLVVDYIDENYANSNLCSTTIADYFKCSESTIRKVFKNTTNVSLTAYIERKRMQRANELLIYQTKTISEIAIECGFNSDNSFYKAYRRFYGHAPSVKRD